MIFILISALICEYVIQKRKIKKRSNSISSFNYIFAFVVLWIFSQVLYFTEAYVDYLWTPQVWITSLPSLFTFLCIALVIDNLKQIAHLLIIRQRGSNFSYRVVASLCVLTQVLNPILAMQESDSYRPDARVLVHEHNAWFVARIMLTTVAVIVLSFYLLHVTWFLAH